MNKTDKKRPQRPFFARFLETQQLRDVGGGGGCPVTLKFPSDADEEGGNPVTLKFPSDAEDTDGNAGDS